MYDFDSFVSCSLTAPQTLITTFKLRLTKEAIAPITNLDLNSSSLLIGACLAQMSTVKHFLTLFCFLHFCAVIHNSDKKKSVVGVEGWLFVLFFYLFILCRFNKGFIIHLLLSHSQHFFLLLCLEEIVPEDFVTAACACSLFPTKASIISKIMFPQFFIRYFRFVATQTLNGIR